ncbi:enoyl-CoA hydratase/carnithine racemase [Caulobacter ginsengisoli]|uniref:Enoyl-CoA hydratase/carnithine racemase n=1 Tax=Caulobacter ginsengisoli TaxID=400775 RepID=A0ABU0IY15_9CAUL|nr:enoyl-CoA hydratase/isomerase family protein [Caulobacter ginsengisoli]MDQ0466894.1 enoyl-CoA hydratase/carnithine racemase [Caulobacter ginsengisoli]
MDLTFDLARVEDEVERLAPMFGSPLRIVELDGPDPQPAGILVGVDRAGRLPADTGVCDLLLTTAADAPRPWVSLAADQLDAALTRLAAAVSHRPMAATALVQALRLGRSLGFDDALILESALYSTLLGGEEFRAWRQATPARPAATEPSPRVALAREGEAWTITLTRPERRNAVDARLRDELVEALRATDADPATAVLLQGQGPDFCAGGDLDEFGSAGDLAAAHFTRILRSPARLIGRQAGRITARVQGGCIGAGIEMSAAAGRLVAAPGAWFLLPEVSMGLIPGAGGTVTLPRRIGRRRTAWMGLLGEPLDTPTALAWGLIDAVEPAP